MSANEAIRVDAAPQRAQGMLFGDPLPELDTSTGYRGPIACRVAGITYRQLDYWARTGLVEPTVRGARGSGFLFALFPSVCLFFPNQFFHIEQQILFL